MNELLEMLQAQIPTITVGLGLIGTLISNKVSMKKKDVKMVDQSKEIDKLKAKTAEMDQTLNDTKNSKAVLKIARQHEERLLRLEKNNEKEKS